MQMFVRNKSISYKITLHSSPSSMYSDGSYPIVLQLTYKRKVYRKRTGFRAHLDQWDIERFISDKRIVRNYRERNDELNQIEEKTREILDKNFRETFSYPEFSSLLDHAWDDRIKFNKIANEYVEMLYDQGRAGTAVYYRDVCKSVENYDHMVALIDIDKDWLRNYVRHYTKKGTKCISYLRGIKAIYGFALREHDIEYSYMPFKTAYNPRGYDLAEAKKIKVHKVKKNGRLIESLSESEMQTLKDYKPNNQGKERAYDLFMFSYYTGGVNAKDIALMKYEHIIDGLWFYEREKTGQGGQGKPLIDKAITIIEKYRNDSEFVFPWILGGKDLPERAIKDRMTNFLSNLRRRYLTISKECEFNGHITFYTARITAATILVNKGANLKAVQTALDHSNISMTSKYIRSVKREVMMETLEML